MTRLLRFGLILVAILVLLGLLVGWLTATIYLPSPWRYVWAIATLLIGFAWVLSAETEDGGW